MKDEIICYLLMHSQEDWKRVTGLDNVNEFVSWVWQEVGVNAASNPELWLQEKVVEYQGK